MGAFVSVPECQSHYNVVVDCSVKGPNKDEDGQVIPPYASLGGVKKGEFEADSDIAGIGVLGVFLAVTSFALALSIVDVLWQLHKRRISRHTIERKPVKYGFSEMLETVVLACSDQQLVTGGAYGITLRYWKGCTISAYHYNIVANMMLLTCATHLMSVTIVRNYWRYTLLALLRVLCTTGVFIVAGLLLTNQNADDRLKFPTKIPQLDETDSLIFLPAACFESEYNTAPETFRNSTHSANAFWDTLKTSEPGNKLPGWNWFLIMVLFYGAAILVEFVRFFRRARSRPGWRARVYKGISSVGSKLKINWTWRIIQWAFLLYLVGGIGIGFATVVVGAKYIMSLRRWVANSGWIQAENGINPEDDWSSFGQLVPIWSTLIVLFGFLTAFSEFLTARNNANHRHEKPPDQHGNFDFIDPDNYNTYHNNISSSLAGTPTLDEAAKRRRQSSLGINGGSKNNTPHLSTTEYFGGVTGLALNSPGTPFLADLEKQTGWSFMNNNPTTDNNHKRTSSIPSTTATNNINPGSPDPQSAAPLLGSISPESNATSSPAMGGVVGGKRFSSGGAGGGLGLQQQQQIMPTTPRPAVTGGGVVTTATGGRYSAIPQEVQEEGDEQEGQQGQGDSRKGLGGSAKSSGSGKGSSPGLGR